MLSCEEVRAALGGVLDGEAAELGAALDAHLAGCHGCRVLWDSTRKTLRLVTESGSFEIPPELSERIRRKVLDAIRARGG